MRQYQKTLLLVWSNNINWNYQLITNVQHNQNIYFSLYMNIIHLWRQRLMHETTKRTKCLLSTLFGRLAGFPSNLMINMLANDAPLFFIINVLLVFKIAFPSRFIFNENQKFHAYTQFWQFSLFSVIN